MKTLRPSLSTGFARHRMARLSRSLANHSPEPARGGLGPSPTRARSVRRSKHTFKRIQMKLKFVFALMIFSLVCGASLLAQDATPDEGKEAPQSAIKSKE